MATQIRNTDPILGPMVTAHNALKSQIGAGAHFHLDASEVVVTSPDATDLPSLLTLVNECASVSLFHRADALALKALDAATIAAPKAIDLATAIALVNELKADHNTHCASTAVHFNADATNTIATANATILSDALTLANAYKAAANAHMADAPAAASLRLVAM